MRRAPVSGFIGRCECGYFCDGDTREEVTARIHGHARAVMLRELFRTTNAKMHGSGHFVSRGAEGDRHKLGCRCGWSASTRNEHDSLEEAITHLNTTDWVAIRPGEGASPKVSDPTRMVVSRGGRRPRGSKTKLPRLNPVTPHKKRTA